MEPFYRPSFERHRHSLVINGFYTRELDADDFAFLEHVKNTGSANGSLPSTNVVLLEELEFWHLPYSIAPDASRTIGKLPRLVDDEDYRAMKRAKRDAWHAQRLIREHDKAIAAAELEREQREWEEAQQKRKMRELISDAEWEAAAPRKASFGKTVERHYVPQWKLDDLQQEQELSRRVKAEEQELARRVKAEKHVRNTVLVARRRAWRAVEAMARAHAEQREQERKLAQEEAVMRAHAEEQALKSMRAAEAAARARERSRTRSQQQAEAIIAARKAIDDSERLARAWREKMYSMSYPTPDSLKQAILKLTGSTPGYVYTRERLLGVLGCNEAALDYCLDALVNEQQLRKVKLET